MEKQRCTGALIAIIAGSILACDLILHLAVMGK